MKRLWLHAIIASVAGLILLAAGLSAAEARSTVRLQSAGESWGSSRAWPRFNADQRSFRFEGASRGGYCYDRTSGFRIFASPQANRGSSLRSNLPASQRATRRSWGSTARYSSRQRIISYHQYRYSGQANRGATIGAHR